MDILRLSFMERGRNVSIREEINLPSSTSNFVQGNCLKGVVIFWTAYLILEGENSKEPLRAVRF